MTAPETIIHLVGVVVTDHDRDDVLAMIDRGDFGLPRHKGEPS